MASSLGLATTTTDRPRRMLPIVPAIPRSLEKKPKADDSRPATSSKAVSPTRKEDEESLDNETPATSIPTEGLHDNAVNGTNEGEEEVRDIPSENDHAAEEEIQGPILSTPATKQDFGIEKHGFQLPPPFYPKESPPEAEAEPVSVSNINEDASTLYSPAEAPQEEDGTGLDEAHPAEHHGATQLMTTGFPTEIQPPDDVTQSPVVSLYNESNPDQPMSFLPQPTSSNDNVSSSVPIDYHSHANSHNVSFYVPPLPPSNQASPLSRSMYQGYSYGPTPYSYSPHSSMPSYSSEFHQNQSQNGTSVEQHNSSQLPHYSPQPPFPLLGSQPPITPSTTPSNNIHQQWHNIHMHAVPNPSSYACPPTDTQLPNPQAHDRSLSNSTLKSETFTPQLSMLVHDATVDIKNNGFEPIARRQNMSHMSQDTAAWSDPGRVPLADHLLQHFNNKEYADCYLYLFHETKRFSPVEWYLSSLMASQSPKLQDLFKSSVPGKDGKKLLEVKLRDRFITPTSIDSALRVLYGAPPASFFGSMAECIAFAATGQLLKMTDVISEGLNKALTILSWDNIETALSFGLESEHWRRCSPSSSVIPENHSSGSTDSDGSHIVGPSSLAPSLPSEYLISLGLSSDIPPLSTGSHFLVECMSFVVENFPTSWELDLSARPLADVDRLPVTAESRSPLSKSMLSRIQFGQHPSEATAKAKDRNVLLSSILFSIPFNWLESFLKPVGEPLARNIDAIIKERERRRKIVFESQSVPLSQRLAAKEYKWAEAGLEESVQVNDNGEISLSQKDTGLVPSVSVSTASEKF